jgi:subtilisin family serine protease
MRNSIANPKPRIGRRLLGAFLCGVVLLACCIGGSHSASAFGFGRMGGFGRPMMGGPVWRRSPPLRGGRFAGPPLPGRRGWPTRHAPIGGGGAVGGGIVGGGIVGGAAARAAGGGNNGGGGAAAQGNAPFVPDEIVTSFAPGTTPQAIAQFAQRTNLAQLESQSFPLIGTSLYRWRIGGGRSVPSVVQALGAENIVATVQPNYLFALQEDNAKAAAVAPAGAGDAAQYVLAELQIAQAHQIATGKSITVAVIDSEIDAKHPDLDGAVVKSFDALAGSDTPHPHGTSIAGAIAAHGKLMGIAPGVRILAVHAFDDSASEAKGTSFAIDKGLQWAADNNARVVNMSFAGPADPMLARMLAAAYAKGIVLIAAAGNGGPQSAPLYPAADPDVIAVTATDNADHVFALANRGRYIAVAAPGVDILALAPGNAYALSSGTSIAAAHVSGIAALLLERNPALKPGDIRSILIATATPIGPPVPDSPFGAGVVNAYRAVSFIDRKPEVRVLAPVAAPPAKQ